MKIAEIFRLPALNLITFFVGHYKFDKYLMDRKEKFITLPRNTVDYIDGSKPVRGKPLFP
jgi:hypothetical protein